MSQKHFNPWEKFDQFHPGIFDNKSSELTQWPIKLWKAPIISPYYHKAHLLVAADCSAFSYPRFHDVYSKGKVPLICCMETDFDIASKLSKILEHNDIQSVSVVKMDKPCCQNLVQMVVQAVKHSRLPTPMQVSTIFVDAEDMETDEFADD